MRRRLRQLPPAPDRRSRWVRPGRCGPYGGEALSHRGRRGGAASGATLEWLLPSLRAKCCGCTGPFQGLRAGSIPVARSAKHHGEWRSLVAHPAGGRAVAGSNPVSPITESPGDPGAFCFSGALSLLTGSNLAADAVARHVLGAAGGAGIAPPDGGASLCTAWRPVLS